MQVMKGREIVESEPGLDLEAPTSSLSAQARQGRGHFSAPKEGSCQEGTRVVEGREPWLY